MVTAQSTTEQVSELHLQGAATTKLRTSRRALCAALAGVLFLGGCVTGGDGDPKANGQVTDENSDGSVGDGDQRADLTGHPVLGPVIWTTGVEPGSSEPVQPVSSIPATALVIYAVFPIERLPGEVSIRASWAFNGTSLDGMDAEVSAGEDQVQGWLEFHLVRTGEEPWPDGEYAITLTSGNVLVATGSVQLTKP